MTDEIDLNALLAKAARTGKAAATGDGEIYRRAAEIRAIAHNPKCKTINDLARAFGWNMETARHANTVLSLGLGDARLRAGPATEAKANPKQPKKQAGK